MTDGPLPIKWLALETLNYRYLPCTRLIVNSYINIEIILLSTSKYVLILNYRDRQKESDRSRSFTNNLGHLFFTYRQ